MRRRRRPSAPVPSWLIHAPSGDASFEGSLSQAQIAAERALHEHAAAVGAVVYYVRRNDRVLTAATYDQRTFTATLERAA